MPHISTVLYPNDDDTTFDMEYYLSTHMPLVQAHWEKYGMKNWQVVQFEEFPAGTKPKYCVQAILVWGDAEQVKVATSATESKAVFDDVKNFSNKSPVFNVGRVVGTSD